MHESRPKILKLNFKPVSSHFQQLQRFKTLQRKNTYFLSQLHVEFLHTYFGTCSTCLVHNGAVKKILLLYKFQLIAMRKRQQLQRYYEFYLRIRANKNNCIRLRQNF